MELVSFFEKLNKFSLYLLLLLFPIFFFPLTQNVLDYPKQILLLFLVSVSLIGFLGKQILQQKFLFKGGKLFYFSLFLIFLSLSLSTIFSISPITSFFGQMTEISDSFLTFLFLLIFSFLLVNSFQSQNEIEYGFLFFIFSTGLSSFLNIFQIYKIFLLPFNITKTPSFNTIGTPNGLSLFLLSLLPITFALTFQKRGYLKFFLIFLSFLFFLNILLINFDTAWLAFIIGILFLFIFSFRGEKVSIFFSLLLMALLAISIFFYLFPASLPLFPSLPPEISLSLPSEAYLIKEAFGEKIKNIFFGTGPSTFVFDYSKFHHPILNQTIFWGTRFSSGFSFFFDSLLTKGLLGGISLLFFYFFVLNFIFKNLKVREGENLYKTKLSLAAGILILIFLSFIYPFNLSLLFSFFFLVSVYFSLSLNTIEKPISNYSTIILSNSIFILFIIFSLSLFFFEIRGLVAEISYLKGLENFQIGELDIAIQKIEFAKNLFPFRDYFSRDLSQVYLAKAILIFQNPQLQEEEKRKLASLSIAKGADAINFAIKIAPFNVANWNVRGFFYRNLIGLEGSERIALSSYQKAAELEPASPFSYGEMGRIYILLAQNEKRTDEKNKFLDSALEELKKAISLKSDYAPAHYLIAVVLDQKGERESAISKLEETKLMAPNDVGIAFQLGLLYWKKNDLEKAEAEFKRALSIFENYSNARYMLGLIYDKKGEKEKAKEEFKKVLELNPQNQEVIKIIDNLNKGLPALEGILPKEPPIQPTPSEIRT